MPRFWDDQGSIWTITWTLCRRGQSSTWCGGSGLDPLPLCVILLFLHSQFLVHGRVLFSLILLLLLFSDLIVFGALTWLLFWHCQCVWVSLSTVLDCGLCSPLTSLFSAWPCYLISCLTLVNVFLFSLRDDSLVFHSVSTLSVFPSFFLLSFSLSTLLDFLDVGPLL